MILSDKVKVYDKDKLLEGLNSVTIKIESELSPIFLFTGYKEYIIDSMTKNGDFLEIYVHKVGWSGFTRESKAFMNYPKCGKIKFWLTYPIALFRYWWYSIMDK